MYEYKTPLNRRSAPYIVRFFDYCYKRGVWDACDHGDDYEVRSFVEEHSGVVEVRRARRAWRP